jgi:hypothetical protein
LWKRTITDPRTEDLQPICSPQWGGQLLLDVTWVPVWEYTERVRILRETLLLRVNRPVGLLEARYLLEVFRVVRDEDEIVGDGAGCYDQVEIVYR